MALSTVFCNVSRPMADEPFINADLARIAFCFA
jgi:hypothetical protein